MDYPQAIDYLLSFADFERGGRFRDRPDVAPVLSLLRRLGEPHLGRTTVHIAGSKGKGSVAAMTESILRAAGHRTGLYTSPHLRSYTERVRIGGEPIFEAEFARLAGRVREAAEAEPEGERALVTFDLLTALGFLAFRDAGADAQVIEVGLGGRVDSTNVFAVKDVAVIAPISLEHTAILGDTIEQIAREKAAIITPGCTAVMAPQAHSDAAQVIRAAADTVGAPLVDVAAAYHWRRDSHGPRGQDVRIEGGGCDVRARLPLLGAHQAENAATAVAAVLALHERGHRIPDESLARGLEGVSWPGRLEVLRESPLVVADGAHNRDSARRLREALRDDLSCARAVFIVGSSSDKDIGGLAEELAPLAERVIAVRADHPRAMSAELVAGAFIAAGAEVEVCDSVGAAIEMAMADAGGNGVICFVGSLFVAAEARAYMAPDRGAGG